MKATDLKPGTTIKTVNFYTGRIKEYVVKAVSKNAHVITVHRDDWVTKEMKLTHRPTAGCGTHAVYWNEYASEMYSHKAT